MYKTRHEQFEGSKRLPSVQMTQTITFLLVPHLLLQLGKRRGMKNLSGFGRERQNLINMKVTMVPLQRAKLEEVPDIKCVICKEGILDCPSFGAATL